MFGIESLANLANLVPAQKAGSGGLSKVLDILGSKGGQTAVNAVGAGLAAYGANKQAEADRAMTEQQFAANMAQRQLENDQQNRMAQTTNAAAANPLGTEQNFAQKQAILKAILGNTQNFSITPGDPRVAAAMGSMSGGARLPQGGFDPAMLDRLFGDAATQSSIAQHSKQIGQINPTAPVADLNTLFGTAENGTENPFQTSIQASNNQALDQQMAMSAKQRELIQRAIDEDIAGSKQKKSKSKKGKAVGAGASALSGAATGASIGSIVPGIGTGIGAGLGAAIGGLKGLFS